MDEITWASPPPRDRGGATKRRDIVNALRKRPGEWALVATGSASNVTSYKQDFPGLEATGRRRPDGKYDVYARWTGEQS